MSNSLTQAQKTPQNTKRRPPSESSDPPKPFKPHSYFTLSNSLAPNMKRYLRIFRHCKIIEIYAYVHETMLSIKSNQISDVFVIQKVESFYTYFYLINYHDGCTSLDSHTLEIFTKHSCVYAELLFLSGDNIFDIKTCKQPLNTLQIRTCLEGKPQLFLYSVVSVHIVGDSLEWK